jgi:hypothetical protein
MTHRCCTSCRARFAAERGAAPDICPLCGRPADHLPAASLVGFRLVATPAAAEPSLEQAVAAALAPPRPARS